jgi:hypothetical protein
MSDCKYPQIKVELIGNDGNAFSVLGSVKRALKNGGVSADEITKFYEEATSGDYNHLLCTVMDWVVITSADEDDSQFEEDETCDNCGELIDFCVCDDEGDDYGYAEQKNFD